jgi:hypothetical protein
VNYLIQIIDVIYVTVGIILGLTGLLYAISSIREKKQRAFYTAIAFTATILIVWFGYYYFFDFSVILLSIPPAFAILAAVLFFAPDGKISAIEINDSDERVDERDIMFAREEYKPGESKYKEYYAAKPQYKEIDDKIRDLPRLLRPGGKYYDPIRSRYIDLIFESVENLTDEVDGEISADREEVEAVEITKSIKKSVLEMGVGDVGRPGKMGFGNSK